MLGIARKNAIREQLQLNKSVRITELALLLNVTKETIRRDLKEMELDGELIRTHGGAYITDGVHNDIEVATRQVIKVPEKKIIAEKCLSLINTGDVIFLDPSTTCWFLAERLVNKQITVLTNSLKIANILSESDTVTLHLVGGKYDRKLDAFNGEGTHKNLSRYFVDKAFISCRTVNMEYGITDPNDDNARVHQIAFDHAGKKYLVVDSSKLNGVSFAQVGPVSSLTGIILDTEFPDNWKTFLKENGVEYY